MPFGAERDGGARGRRRQGAEAVYGVPAREVKEERRVVLTEAWGRPIDQRYVNEVAEGPDLTIICGRYGGVDERARSPRDGDRLDRRLRALRREIVAAAPLTPPSGVSKACSGTGIAWSGSRSREKADRTSPVHPPRRLERYTGPRRAPFRRPREDKSLAGRTGTPESLSKRPLKLIASRTRGNPLGTHPLAHALSRNLLREMRHGLRTRDGEAVFGMLLSGNHESPSPRQPPCEGVGCGRPEEGLLGLQVIHPREERA